MAERYLNKKLKRAIDNGYELFWEFGEYNTWYRGLILRAYTGFAETGRKYIHIVFATTSIDGAKEICETLKQKGTEADAGWDEALLKYESHKRGWKSRYPSYE